MASESVQNRGSGRAIRRTALLFGVILLLIAGWSAAWYWGAELLRQRVATAGERLVGRGGSLDCADSSVGGYPFRIGLFCSELSVLLPKGDRLRAGALRSAAQLYAPGRVVAELDGPARFETAGSGGAQLGWQSARGSFRFGLDGPRSASVELREPVLLLPAGNAEIGSATARLHLRRNPDEPAVLDLALDAEAVDATGPAVPTFGIIIDSRLDGLADHLEPGFDLATHLRKEGLSGELRSLVLTPAAGGRLTAGGPFTLDRDGVLDGRITLSAEDLPALAHFAQALFPEHAEEIRSTAALLSSAVPATGPGSASPKLTVTITRGAVSLGFIPLGTLPPLW